MILIEAIAAVVFVLVVSAFVIFVVVGGTWKPGFRHQTILKNRR